MSTVVPEMEGQEPSPDSPDEAETRELNFDKLFGSLATIIPKILWSVLMHGLGKENDPPSVAAMAQMKEGWKTFFDSLGVEYAGEGLHYRLTNPLWLVFIPIAATFAAVFQDLGIDAFVHKKEEIKQGE